jgi:Right handed beta helix region
MTKITWSILLAALAGFFLHVASAQAQYVHTCVSAAAGNDANTCHCTQPCRTFQRAHTQTLDQGQITVLDPGGYGPVTITKSISIVNDGGGVASVIVSGNNAFGINVNAPAAGYVNLRGLTIQGVGFGIDQGGVIFASGFSLTITDCVIRNLTGNGIVFGGSGNSLVVADTLVADNGGSGIFVNPEAGTRRTMFNRVQLYHNSEAGIWVRGGGGAGTLDATVTDSVAYKNAGSGFLASTVAGGGSTSLWIFRSVAANNFDGLKADIASILVGQSTVKGNTNGLTMVNGGSVTSYGDNNIDGNGGTQTPTGTINKK